MVLQRMTGQPIRKSLLVLSTVCKNVKMKNFNLKKQFYLLQFNL